MDNWKGGAGMTVVASVVVMGWVSLTVMGDRGPVLHKVGGSKGWINHDVNYTEWSSQEHVYVGDWLIFKFDKRYFNVLEVNKTSYESCMDMDFIANITRGGRDVVQMTEAKTYYYLSGGGYCFNGMRVAVNVEEYQDPAAVLETLAPSPSPVVSSASGSSLLLSSPLCTCIWIVVAAANVVAFVNFLF